MGAFSVSVVGTDRVVAAFDRICDAIEEAAEDAAVAAALPYVNESKRLAPVKTGNLRRSVHIGGHAAMTPDTRIGSDRTSYHEMPAATRDGDVTWVTYGTNVEYAKDIEYGGKVRTTAAAALAIAKFGGGEGPRRGPRPFMRAPTSSPMLRDKAGRGAQAVIRRAVINAARGGS